MVCSGVLTEKLIAQSCITPGVKNVFSNLLTTAAGTCRFFTLPLPKPLSGKTYREIVRHYLRANAPFVVCGFLLQGEPPTPMAIRTCAEPDGVRDDGSGGASTASSGVGAGTRGAHDPISSTASGTPGDAGASGDPGASDDVSGPGAPGGPDASDGPRGTAHLAHALVLNPRGGWSPGRDTTLAQGDHLVLMAHERPDLEGPLASST